MDIRRKRILRVILPMLLIMSFLSQSVVSLAKVGTSTEAGDGGKSVDNTTVNGAMKPDGHYGWLISIQEVDNKYFGQGESYPDYSECDLSIWKTYLYDYPTEYVEDAPINADKYAYIDRSNGDGSSYSRSKTLYIANTSGNASSKTVANVYGSGNYYKNYASSFESNAQLIETNAYYETIKELLEKRELTLEYLRAAGVESNITNAIYSFVGLWWNSEDADENINNFVFGKDGEELSYDDQLIRYLDLLLIVNAMCNNAYDDYIDDFCYNHNQDYSSKFVTILIASTITAKDGNAIKECLWTLPVWYAYRAQGTVSVDALLHYDGVGSGSIFSTANTTDNGAALQSFYNSNAPDKIGTGFTSDGEAANFWWYSGKRSALTTAPTGVDGSTPGNMGYTYISTVGLEPDPEKKIDSSSSSSSSGGGSGSGSVDNIQNLIDRIDLEFYISVESNEYMLRATESGGDVDQQQVTVTIF